MSTTPDDNNMIVTVAGTAATKALITAEQIEADCPERLQQIGKEITARLAKADKKAKEANDHLIAVNQLLAEAKGLCDCDGFEKFRETFCPQLGRSQAYAMLAIAAGRKSIEEHRAGERKRKQRTRARQKETKESGTVPDSRSTSAGLTVAGMNGASALPSPAMAWTPPAAPPPPKLEPEAEAAEPTVEEAEAEVKRLKAERAALKDKIKANGEDDTKIDPKASAKALAEFRSACETFLSKMEGDDLENAINHFADAVNVPAAELMPDLNKLQFDLKIAKADVTALKRRLAGKAPPRESRTTAWVRLAEEATGCIQALIDYQQEFESAKEAQPDSLQEGPFAQKCEAVCEIDLASALEIVHEAESADLPLGFGRDA